MSTAQFATPPTPIHLSARTSEKSYSKMDQSCILSNKENTPIIDLSGQSPAKPRMGGIGRPSKTSHVHSRFHHPSFKKRGVSISKSKGKVALKRRISVRRKLRSKSGKLNRMEGVEEIPSLQSDTSRSETPLVVTPTPTIESNYLIDHSSISADGLPTYTLVSQPRLGDDVAKTRVLLPAVGYPFRLMRDPIPPVTSTTTDGTTVPIHYMMKYLTSHLPLIWRTRWEYVAAPHWPHSRPARLGPPPEIGVRVHRLDDVFDEIPIYVKNAPYHNGLNWTTQQKFEMRSPNICLAIRQEGHLDQQAYLCPINEAVISSRCAYYDQLVSRASTLRRGDPILPPAEDPEEEDRRIEIDLAKRFCPQNTPKGSKIRSISAPISSTRTTLSIDALLDDTSVGSTRTPRTPTSKSGEQPHEMFNCATRSDHLDCDASDITQLIGYKRIPLIPIYVPHYASIQCLFYILHHPNQLFVHLLLSVEPLEAFSETAALEITTDLPPKTLIQLMNNLLGLVKNVNAFGISNEHIWSQLQLAHSIILEAMRRRGAWIRPDRNYVFFPNLPDTAKLDDYQVVDVTRGAKCSTGMFWFPTNIFNYYHNKDMSSTREEMGKES